MKQRILLLLLGLSILSGCAGLSQLAAFAKCDFEFEKIENVQLAAIDVQKASTLTELSFTDLGKITNALLSKNLILEMTAVMKVNNPNTQVAALNKTDWILKIDGKEITRGTTDQRVEIPPKGVGFLPIKTSFNLVELFSGESKANLYKLARNVAGVGDAPSKVEVLVKPSISVAGIQLAYPDWITVERKVGK